jgi:beta-N-acetylhexosaminidase
MAITAHVIYASVDAKQPATTSAKVVEDIIRGEIGFDGLLMSDDVSMKALSGSFADRAAAILGAGVDLVLHCNGAMDEMRAVASRVTELEGRSSERAARALAARRPPADDDEEALREEFASYLAVA